ncbi:MAG TPA: hypothetical protein VMT93_10135 [Gemmatimonadaceae bacterium]|nr:hypothetical protein [Gemmatimonadaceae bacterium]
MGTTNAPAENAPPAKRRRKWKWILAAVVLAPFAGIALYTWAALTFTYSRGERAGYLQKFSQKGWLCKTWEGEIAMANLPGTMPQIFTFSVRNDSIAGILNGMSGQRVNVTYEQHRGVPTTCFGETEYFAVGAQRLPSP